MELPSNLIPDEANPEWMNKGDNAWQLTAATLVGLQSIPGLVILYGSMVKRKWAINSAFMAFYAFAMVIVCWVGWAYNMSFGEKLVVFVGKPRNALDEKSLLGKAFLGYFPTATMVFYQGVFACITLILIAGCVIGRMNFRAWVMFVPLWLTFSYTVSAFSIWNPQGWLARLGIIDFAGGYVIHLSAGVAGYTAAFWVGPRMEKDRENFPANNMIVMLAGAGLLWMGWSGFNGGAPFAASIDTSLAVLNTHVYGHQHSHLAPIRHRFLGEALRFWCCSGMITGLVCITPAAGVVQGWAAMIMGTISGSVPWYTMMVLQRKLKFLQIIDDPISIFHTHAIASILGGVLTGFLAVPKLCRLFYLVPDWDKYIGLAYALKSDTLLSEGFHQMQIQLLGIVFVTCLNIASTSLICLFIGLIVPLRLSNAELQAGDIAIHGEEAFVLWSGENRERFENYNHNSVYDTHEEELSYVRSKYVANV